MTTIAVKDSGTDVAELDAYARLGTHTLRYTVEDVERIKQCLVSAQTRMPDVARAFQRNDIHGFADACGSVELDLLRALARAESLLAALRAE